MKLTDQQIFDQCVSHVLKQGIPSVNGDGRCFYSYRGRHCAIGGPLAKIGAPLSKMEGCTVSDLSAGAFQSRVKVDLFREWLAKWGADSSQFDLLDAIQDSHDKASNYKAGNCVHDPDFLTEFRARSWRVAVKFSLDPAVLDA